MYVQHIPRYTGFGLGQNQPIAYPNISASPFSNFSIPESPLSIGGYPLTWTQLLAIVGGGVIVLSVFQAGRFGARKVSAVGAHVREVSKRKQRLEQQKKELPWWA